MMVCDVALQVEICRTKHSTCWLTFPQKNIFGRSGHQQGDWRRNQMHDNGQYGFDPHDDSDLLNIHDNVVYNNGNHGIIASKRCASCTVVSEKLATEVEKYRNMAA